MNKTRLLLAVAAITLSAAASAQVHRCKDASGKISYSDAPCAPAQQGALIERQRTPEEIHEERMRAAEANERKYRQQQAEAMREGTMQQRPMATGSGQPADRSNTHECRMAQRDLEVASASRVTKEPEKRNNMNAAIARVNTACGTNTPLLQEPARVVNQSPRYMTGPNGQQCVRVGNTWNCN